MSEVKDKIAEYIKTHEGVWTSDIVLKFNDDYSVEEVVDALDALLAEGLVKAETPKRVVKMRQTGLYLA